ncbi:MAG TPA: MauE/DoxX family redox-associated membrane protein [Acidimicrobiales bacterium]|nr:MauE/DoxX family redox-associated membrane protein [Acidimicrobiales bacterium]
MDGAVVPALVAAGLLALAGAMKVVDPTMTSGALREMGLPSHPELVRLLALGELVLGVVAVVVGGSVVWTLVAASYIAFGMFVVAALRVDAPIGSCGCFGRADTPPHWLHVVIDVGIWTSVVTWVARMERAPLDELGDASGGDAILAVAASLALVAFLYAGFTGAARARATR